jgi:hypothetical protein
MAILPQLPGVEITIEVSYQPLQEIQTPEQKESTQSTNKFSTYVVSEAGTEFSIRTKFENALQIGDFRLAMEIDLDGKTVRYNAIPENRPYERIWSGAATPYGDVWCERKFKFSEVQTSRPSF